MTVIAHLSDPHLLDHHFAQRSRSDTLRLRYLNWGRPMNTAARCERFRAALDFAWSARPDHLVITGDLTEDGHEAQLELAAELLIESPFAPNTVTLVPGNHDIYHRRDAWTRALDGPLRPWAATSSFHSVIDLRDITLVPVSTVTAQSWLVSYGTFGLDPLRRLVDLADRTSHRGNALVVPQHHTPVPLKNLFLQHFDGLRDHAAVISLLRRSPQLSILHGHIHKPRADALDPSRSAQIFSVGAVLDASDSVRFYRPINGLIEAFDPPRSAPPI